MPSSFKIALTLLKHRFDPFQIITFLEIARPLKKTASILDVGCGAASPLRWFGFQLLAGIEGYAPSFEQANTNHTHHTLVFGDVRNLQNLFQPGQFEACVALDVIEHLPKEDGHRLIQAMESIASKQILFLTPNGFLPQQHAQDSDLQEHLSGWNPDEMRRLGYHVVGILGPKKLRGPYHVLKYRPKLFWAALSLLGHFFWTRWQPRHAAAILCFKRKP